MVKIKKLGPEGHEEIEVPKEEAERMIEAEAGRYFVVSEGKILREVKLKEDQELMLVPIIKGG